VNEVVIKAARKQLETMYRGRCTVYTVETVTDEITHLSRSEQNILYDNVPCHKSYDSSNVTDEYGGSRVVQTVTLFIGPEYDIQEGTKIKITQDNRTETFARSAPPKIYPTHQEIQIERVEEWA
jgi:hypothetical protein